MKAWNVGLKDSILMSNLVINPQSKFMLGYQIINTKMVIIISKVK